MKGRAVFIEPEIARAIKDGSEFCAKLAAIEHAHLIDNEEEVDYLLSNVDPIEARHAADILMALWQLWNVLPSHRGGTEASEPPAPAFSPTPVEQETSAPIPLRRVFACDPDESAGAYEASDPKHPDFHSVHADHWDAREPA